jgi:hypothetical protein
MDRADRQPPHADLLTAGVETAAGGSYVEAVAQRVVELIHADNRADIGDRLVDAATLAGELGVERSWVYEHAHELHPIRLGSGPRARLRFNPRIVRGTLVARSFAEQAERASVNAGRRPPNPRRDRKRATRSATVGRVLAVRPRGEA